MTMALRWGLPAVVIAACVGYLIYSASGGSSEYYLTVSQLRTQAPTGDVRVAGVVQNDVQKSGGGLHVTFTEKDGTASMPVEYTGTLPDIFQPGITVVVEGRLAGDGVFHARTLLAKCPSRFSTQPYTQ
ncbi:MAG: cytochrome c maturation protein CcmE [Chloroflexi bacterium]|nr:MAG: cytochrome c maturation protein CcmE [Chloroflexota bacterium]TME37593.1 MAG: cytochrome c maturation protein CcmE [Chloroflexota bacterium]TME50178.1 MAG: cytochrome c maturation protein CcmE [Chloroflexota bacterium]